MSLKKEDDGILRQINVIQKLIHLSTLYFIKHYDKAIKPRRFLIDVEETQRLILEQEDTDGDFQITVNDMGPKVITLGTADSAGFNKYDVRGTYMLSNLLQELSLAQDYGRKYVVLDEARLNENPVDRLSRMIRHHFWDGLTRRIDAEGLEMISNDPKNRSKNTAPRIYIPHGEDEILAYYENVKVTKPNLNLEVEQLPKDITPKYVQSINDKPGILALAMTKHVDEEGHETLKGVPFVVPGGRFNEMYGWDSYFESLGLLVDGRLELAKGMVDNFVYEIQHYGKILNANRSYYLTRTQPPFLTDMMLKVYDRLPPVLEAENKQWLALTLTAAIKEYFTVWMSEPRFDPVSGLSRFYSEGVGMPPETEASHFDHVIKPYADAMNMTIEEYCKHYNEGTVIEPELDTYFKHDRAVRESGHDTSYRLDNCCADLATVDLNALLYKYEMDIGETIHSIFGDSFETPFFESYETLSARNQDKDGISHERPTIVMHTSAEWFERARIRQKKLDHCCWNEDKGLYFDYDTRLEKMCTYESVTTFYTMWAGCADREKAEKMMTSALPLFEVTGGLVSGTERSRGIITLSRPNRQWDFPFGWAPHQIISWIGFERYGFLEEAKRTCYRWLFTITKSFVDFNGVVPEKFDIVNMTHRVQVEYGNVGLDFKFIPREGFGWMNASYQVGLGYMDRGLRRALGAVMDPNKVFESRELEMNKKKGLHNKSFVEQPPDVTTRLVRPHRT
ncbi:trehalase-domain-containing protein [Lobosporangium transversale]|uniref:Trehalase n=1 Tax=Lobosporangium transversale TaxID=64571 RepID=A0A1Y2GAQ6_9FUNG|nr:trehalase-domain-containing protein [Lobosporangium transversale]ORY98383.1 trehalase-domain-containing protein [Lobosporangium transversale]|eukprot:XP_021875775.1 trehalase-domain-containing protein [Lobosporangium transversale]